MASALPRLLALVLTTILPGCSGGPPGPGERDMGDKLTDLAGAPDQARTNDLAGAADLAADGAVGRPPILDLDHLALVVNLGDSVGAGYNAAGRNGSGGHGFARLLVNNHPDFPGYNGHDLATLYPGVLFRDLAQSGATSNDMLATLKGALAGGLPASVAGDVLVTMNIGGNDFNDKVDVMVDPAKTAVVAMNLRKNLAEAVRLLRARYEKPADGKAVVVLLDNIHDPTDGTGDVPATFNSGFCKTIHNPLLALVRMQVLANLATMNSQIAAEAAAQRAYLVDIHAGFIGHGMNAGAGRFIDTDCVHPINPGHDLIRRLAWQALTGEMH